MLSEEIIIQHFFLEHCLMNHGASEDESACFRTVSHASLTQEARASLIWLTARCLSLVRRLRLTFFFVSF